MDDASDLYERDFVIWADQQGRALRSATEPGSNLAIDWANVAEEIEGLARTDRRELKSRLETVLEHLLKLRFSLADHPRAGWRATIDRTRAEIGDILDDSPSLRREVPAMVADVTDRATRRILRELADRGEIAGGIDSKVCAADIDAEKILDDGYPT